MSLFESQTKFIATMYLLMTLSIIGCYLGLVAICDKVLYWLMIVIMWGGSVYLCDFTNPFKSIKDAINNVDIHKSYTVFSLFVIPIVPLWIGIVYNLVYQHTEIISMVYGIVLGMALTSIGYNLQHILTKNDPVIRFILNAYQTLVYIVGVKWFGKNRTPRDM
jgi:hypothetical protein